MKLCVSKEDGYATLRRLNETVDFSSWKTLTPEATVRRIVKLSKSTFRVRPGQWALDEARGEVLKKFKIKDGDRRGEELFSHSYYQGLLVEIGRLRNAQTYIPPRDQHHIFFGKGIGTNDRFSRTPDVYLRQHSSKG